MNTWIATALATIAKVIATASARHLGIACGAGLILLGIPFNSLALVIFGGAVVAFSMQPPRTDANQNADS